MLKINLKTLGATLLVSGTSIGGAMLSIPLETAHLELYYVIPLLSALWFFTWLSATFLLESHLAIGKDHDFNSLAQHYLGSSGRIITQILYLALLYALISAYLTGLSPWWNRSLGHLFDFKPYPGLHQVLTALPCAWIIAQGTAGVERGNQILSWMMLIAYALILSTAWPALDWRALFTTSGQSPTPAAYLKTLPLLVTSFGFSIVVPSLSSYLNFQPAVLNRSLLIGSFIPLLCYVAWEASVFSLISQQDLMQHRDQSTLVFLLQKKGILQRPWQKFAFNTFEITAILTSFLGVSQSLYHFLKDSFKTAPKKLLLALTFMPAILIGSLHQSTFRQILSFAGLLVAVLLGILPSLFSLRALQLNSESRSWMLIPGGVCTRVIVIVVFSLIVLQDLFSHAYS